MVYVIQVVEVEMINKDGLLDDELDITNGQ
jgi:hypothetical protein